MRTFPEGVDVVGLPGGFSYGDYLSCGAIAAHSPILGAVRRSCEAGRASCIGICNGFQVLLRDGSASWGADAQLQASEVPVPAHAAAYGRRRLVRVFTCVLLARGRQIRIAHGASRRQLLQQTSPRLDRLEGEDRVAFRYRVHVSPTDRRDDIAGVLSENRRVLGMMPHPERAFDAATGSTMRAALRWASRRFVAA
jgi:phosphoribosylformylglycinamidine synthase subunit PurQ / glutaminase